MRITTHRARKSRVDRSRRRGNIIVLSALLLVLVMGLVAMAVELGMVYLARCESQRAADSAALSAAWALVDEQSLEIDPQDPKIKKVAMDAALEFASLNPVHSGKPKLAVADIEIGYLSDPTNPKCALDLASKTPPNAVRVSLKNTSSKNGLVNFGFARVFGFQSQGVQSAATAAFINKLDGFRAPGDGSNLPILPFALKESTWNSLMAGSGADDWTWDPQLKRVRPGSDGIKEVKLYPQSTGASGNRGTVDIGSRGNSTSDLGRQIRNGISRADLARHGGELRFDKQGKLYLGADPGMSAGMKDDLAAIVGQPRAIPIYREIKGNGNGAKYTIVKFVGIRLVESGGAKNVIVQPTNMIIKGAIAGSRSEFLYSSAWIVR